MGAIAATLAVAMFLQVAPSPMTDADEPPVLEEKTGTIDGDLHYYCPPTCTVEQSLRQASARYGVSYARLDCLAMRESTRNPGAQNGRYMGLMQFDATTWALTPYAEYSPYNAWAAAHGAAYLIARGEGRRWPPLAYC